MSTLQAAKHICPGCGPRMMIEMRTLTQDVTNAIKDELVESGLVGLGQETSHTYMSVQIARQLTVLLWNLLHSKSHRKSVVNNSVTKLEKVRIIIETVGGRISSQIISHERGENDKLETHETRAVFDLGHSTRCKRRDAGMPNKPRSPAYGVGYLANNATQTESGASALRCYDAV